MSYRHVIFYYCKVTAPFYARVFVLFLFFENTCAVEICNYTNIIIFISHDRKAI